MRNIGVAKKYAEEMLFSEMTYINGYDDPEIIAGAGTMGLELVIRRPTRTRTTTSWRVRRRWFISWRGVGAEDACPRRA